ncbi:hypothetical protein OG870_25630 [Streptomyces sp. NBC_00461]|uniref:hypothetical protein n=1 Tax=Streptomyces sp. NBC_00461 TaxID=2975750 RepID=UPI002E196BA9
MSQTTAAIRLGGRAAEAYQESEPTSTDLAEQFLQCARELDTALSLVALEGPEEADVAATELVGAVRAWANSLALAIAVDEGRFVPPSGATIVGVPEVLRGKDESHEALDAFTVLGRKLLDN